MFKRLATLFVAVWIVKGFAAIDDLVGFLNVLPPDEAVGAKTVTLGPNRNLMGVATPGSTGSEMKDEGLLGGHA